MNTMNTFYSVWRSFETIREMMHARGAHDVTAFLDAFTAEELKSLYVSAQIFVLDVGNALRLVYCLAPKFKTADVKKYIEPTHQKIILVVREKLSSTNTKTILDGDQDMQVFSLAELQFNISKHSMVPEHQLIPVSEEARISDILQSLGIKTKNQLPVILKSDAMARFLNAKSGDIVQITRASPTSGEHTFYRLCI